MKQLTTTLFWTLFTVLPYVIYAQELHLPLKQIEFNGTIRSTESVKLLDGTLILFSSNREGNYKLFTAKPDGSEVVRLTNSTNDDQFGRFSNDGEKVIFVRNNSSIYIMNRDGSNEQYICEGQSADFSRDAKKVVYENKSNIYIMDLDTKKSTERLKADVYSGSYSVPDWSPTMDNIILSNKFLYSPPFVTNIGLFGETGTGDAMPLTNYSDLNEGYTYDPRYSPSGVYIVYSHSYSKGTTTGSNKELWLMGPAGSDQRGVASSKLGGIDNPMLSPDDKYFICGLNGRLVCIELANLNNGWWVTDGKDNCIMNDWVSVKTTEVVSTKENHPGSFILKQNYPNPFNPVTKIEYSIPAPDRVVLKIYDALGNEISTLTNDEKPAGNYSVEFNAGNLASGIYFYQLRTGNIVLTNKMLLAK